MATAGLGFQKTMQAMRAIAEASTCTVCGRPKISLAQAWRGRGNAEASAHFDPTQFTALCKCVPCGGCGERGPRAAMQRRMMDRAPGADPEPTLLCATCADVADAREIL